MEKPRGIFITGTDTDVGKTIISGALARALQNRGMDCGVMKPMESGCPAGKSGLIPRDGRYLKQAAQSTDPLQDITPVRFQKPMAPYAAELEGEHAAHAFSTIQETANKLFNRHDFLIVEGVGGLLAPLTRGKSVIDLIKTLQLPVLLVARSGLGTLNHSLLTLRYGESQGLTFLGVILNQTTSKPAASEKTNLYILRELTGYPVWGPFPHFGPKGRATQRIAQSAKILEETKTLRPLVEQLTLL